MSEDYIKGFKDGFAIGLEEGKRNQNLNPVPKYDPWVPKSPDIIGSPGCAVCGRYYTGPMGYVCTHPSCPTRVTCYTTGAVGSMSTNEMPKGANGPAGHSGPSSEEEKERLDRYNQVWVNGQWAELGN